MMTLNSEVHPKIIDEKVYTSFPDVCVHKGMAATAGLSGRVVPAFVLDWLVSKYSDSTGQVNSAGIRKFIERYLPDKQQKETLKYSMCNGNPLKILDAFSVKVHPKRGTLELHIPSLDITGRIHDSSIIDANPLLLQGNVWGSGTLTWMPSQEKKDEFDTVMTTFNPMQAASIDLEYFLAQREKFTLPEWLAVLTRSMGYDESQYSTRQKTFLLTRLLPLIEPRVNILELAPKGTGKSYIYSQLSRHAWLISGGVVTRAQLFYDMNHQRPGIISHFNAVILDEIQTIKLSNEGEIVGALKGYLESGEYRVMGFHGSSDAGFVILGNIPIMDGRPRDDNFFSELPRWLNGHDATALLDRFHALVPGWELPRIQSSSLCQSFALRADYFGEVIHALRSSQEHMAFVKTHTASQGDLRDTRAVQRLACGYLKLLFPDVSNVSLDDFETCCLQPARDLRLNVRSQMARMDPEFSPEIARITVC
ncbi:MAG: BREX system Lon protease-like protein BrxL [Candidatus Electrothrix sp. EH2]|nr:BREX system Lon protease-like protein BrxL [Candidatus Electrothrix sp. EH2]